MTFAETTDTKFQKSRGFTSLAFNPSILVSVSHINNLNAREFFCVENELSVIDFLIGGEFGEREREPSAVLLETLDLIKVVIR